MRRKTAMCSPLSLRSSGALAARPNGSTGVCRAAGERYEKPALSTADRRIPDDDRPRVHRPGQHGQARRAGRAASVQRPDLSEMVARIEWDRSNQAHQGLPGADRLQNAIPGRPDAADARQEPRRATAVRGREHSHFRCLHQTGPAGARQPAGQTGRDGQVHRLHGRCAPDWPRRKCLWKPLVVVEGKGTPRRIGDAGNPGIARVGDRKRWSRGLPPACLKRNATGTGAESSHRGGILVRRSSPGVSDEPQLCPDDVDETETKIYDPPWGSIAPLELANGQPIIPPGYAANLQRALTDISDRTNARLRFIGYTKNERLDRRTASVYGDDIGLSAARARRAMDALMKDPLL